VLSGVPPLTLCAAISCLARAARSLCGQANVVEGCFPFACLGFWHAEPGCPSSDGGVVPGMRLGLSCTCTASLDIAAS